MDEKQELSAINWGGLFSRLQQLLPILAALLDALTNLPPDVQRQVVDAALQNATQEQRQALRSAAQ